MKKKFGVEFTENKNGRLEKYTIYADSIKEAMDFIELSKRNKKAAIKIIDNDNRLIHKEEHHNHGHNGHHGHEHHEDDDYMYA